MKEAKKALSALLVLVLTLTMVVGTSDFAKADNRQEGTYSLDYLNAGSADVKVNATSIAPNVNKQFEPGSEITYTLTKPDGTAGTDAFMEIEVFDNDPDDPDSNPTIKTVGDGITKDGAAYSFTPASDTPFVVHIWWTEAEKARFGMHITDGFDENVKVYYKVNAGEYKSLAQNEWYGFERLDASSLEDVITFKIETNTRKTFWKFDEASDREHVANLLGDSKLSVNEDAETHKWTLTYADTLTHLQDKFFEVGLCYPNGGRSGIVGESKNYIYAYGKNAGAITEAELKTALASELFDRFIAVDMFGEFGLDKGNASAAISDLTGRITLTANGSVSATKKDATTETISKYTATVNWGLNEDNGEEIQSSLTVYALPNNHSMLICTDFNNGSGTKYYLRDTSSDAVDFTTTGDNGILVVDSFTNVAIGAYGAVTDKINETGNYATFEVATRGDRQNLGETFGTQVRVLKPSGSFVSVHESGESKNVDGLMADGYKADTIYEAANGIVAPVYIGNSTVTIGSVINTGLAASKVTLSNVELKNNSDADGVTITKNGAVWDLAFQSNFYDSVTLKLTFDGGSEKEITIQRIGLVVHSTYLMAEDSTGHTNYDCYGAGDNGPGFSYDYQNGEQILVYATYYHPSTDPTGGNTNLKLVVTFGDGSKEVFTKTDTEHGFNGYKSGSSYGAVDTTSFIIDMIPAYQNQDPNDGTWLNPITSQNYKGGFHAIVVNDGYDNADSFGGAQIGNGLGVYWDGNIKWGF